MRVRPGWSHVARATVLLAHPDLFDGTWPLPGVAEHIAHTPRTRTPDHDGRFRSRGEHLHLVGQARFEFRWANVSRRTGEHGDVSDAGRQRSIKPAPVGDQDGWRTPGRCWMPVTTSTASARLRHPFRPDEGTSPQRPASPASASRSDELDLDVGRNGHRLVLQAVPRTDLSQIVTRSGSPTIATTSGSARIDRLQSASSSSIAACHGLPGGDLGDAGGARGRPGCVPSSWLPQ